MGEYGRKSAARTLLLGVATLAVSVLRVRLASRLISRRSQEIQLLEGEHTPSGPNLGGRNTGSSIDGALLGSSGENITKLGNILPLSYHTLCQKRISHTTSFPWLDYVIELFPCREPQCSWPLSNTIICLAPISGMNCMFCSSCSCCQNLCKQIRQLLGLSKLKVNKIVKRQCTQKKHCCWWELLRSEYLKVMLVGAITCHMSMSMVHMSMVDQA